MGECDEAGGVAARVGDALRAGDLGALLRVELREPVRPLWVDAVRRARVDEHALAVARQIDRLDGGCVREAEDGGVRGTEGLRSGLRVLPVGLVQRDQLHVAPLRQPVAHLQACGPSLAIDEDLLHAFRHVNRHGAALLRWHMKLLAGQPRYRAAKEGKKHPRVDPRSCV